MTKTLPGFETFLEKAGLVGAEEINDLSATSLLIGMPIGRLLTLENKITTLELRNISLLHAFVLDQVLSLEQALQLSHELNTDSTALLIKLKNFPGANIASSFLLGEILLEASVITEESLSQALKLGLDESILLGHALLRLKTVSPLVLSEALQLQSQKRAGEIKREAAISQLSAFHKNNQ